MMSGAERLPIMIIPMRLHQKWRLCLFLQHCVLFYTEAEEHTNKGRMDLTIMYIFEFNFNASAKVAMKQTEYMAYTNKIK